MISGRPRTADSATAQAHERERSERVDAARNRAKILATAEQLVASKGVHALSLNEVAAAAEVGVGTVYRRFGDQSGLVEALMDERETQLQKGMTEGEPPLGPGAPPLERARGFVHAYIDLLDSYAPLMAVAEMHMPAARRYRTEPYQVHHQHLTELIEQARPDTNASLLAHSVLAALAPGMFTYLRQEEERSIEQLKAGMDFLINGLSSA